MTISYNLQARNHLKRLLNQSDKTFTLSSLYKKSKKLLQEYDENPEFSYAARISFLKSLLGKISRYYEERVYQHKTLWKKFLYFIGWLNTEESVATSFIKQVSLRIKDLEAE